MSGPDPEPPDSALVEGARLLGEGRWREAHEVFEDGWRRSQGSLHSVFHALAQLGAALLKWSERKPAPATTLFGRIRGRLEGLPSQVQTLDVEALESMVIDFQERVARGEVAPRGVDLVLGVEETEKSDAAALAAQCPYCGERVTVQVEPIGADTEQYVEDCPVCCRPWTVEVARDESGPSVHLHREDD
jgi:Cysteine-rich CPXCG/Domain of unknown function (DUF309)